MMRDYSIMINRGLQGKKTGGHRIDHACDACVFIFYLFRPKDVSWNRVCKMSYHELLEIEQETWGSVLFTWPKCVGRAVPCCKTDS